MSLFEVLYGRRCRTPLYWQEIDDALIIGPKPVEGTGDPREDKGCPERPKELRR